jgi:hypothetical protein
MRILAASVTQQVVFYGQTIKNYKIMKENVVHRKAFDFAIRVYTYCKWLKSEKKGI